MCHGSCSTMPHAHKGMKNFGLLALRLAIGAIFIYSGYGKLFTNHEMVAGMMGKFIGPASAGSFWAYLVGSVEFFGGFMVLLGVFATYAAALLSVVMVVAIMTVHWSGPFTGMYAPLAILGGTLALMGSGAGRYRLVSMECFCPKCKAMFPGGKCEPKPGETGGCCGGKK